MQNKSSFLVRPTVALALAVTMVWSLTISAQTLSVLHNFSGGRDGANPYAGVTVDRAGNIYGTTSAGGNRGGGCTQFGGCGTVFKLRQSSSGWILSSLYVFDSGRDGFDPLARVLFGPDGSLFGTTSLGGHEDGGTVFELSAPAGACKSALCLWNQTVSYLLNGGSGYGDLTFGASGSIYGTTVSGGNGLGMVFELTPSNGVWAETDLYAFNGQPDGEYPYSGVVFDQAGRLYGTTLYGGGGTECGYQGCGAVYQLTPSMSGWTEAILYAFQDGSDGAWPYGGVILDQAGNLYGTTTEASNGGGGTLYKLVPSGDSWTLAVLHTFSGSGPFVSLAINMNGNLYGTAEVSGAYGHGSVFELKLQQNGSWVYVDLHDFTGGSDGANPFSSVAFDGAGHLYGTASSGGAFGYGVVWEITP